MTRRVVARGEPLAAVAADLGRRPEAVRRRLHLIGAFDSAQGAPPRPRRALPTRDSHSKSRRTVRCLGCSRPFSSFDPTRNRLCYACSRSASSMPESWL